MPKVAEYRFAPRHGGYRLTQDNGLKFMLAQGDNGVVRLPSNLAASNPSRP